MKIESKYFELVQKMVAENDYPGERTARDQGALRGFTTEFNRRTGLDVQPDVMADTLDHIRKCERTTGGLPRVGRSFDGPRFN